MSLLLDALKRAEEAKRAKLSIDSGPDAEGNKATTAPATGTASTAERIEDDRAVASAEAELKLEYYKEVIPAKTIRPSPDTKSAARVLPRGTELSLENIADAGTGPSATQERAIASSPTAALATQSRLDATRLDAAQSRDTARNVFGAKQTPAADGASRKTWLLPVIAVSLLAVGGGGWYVWNEVNRAPVPATNLSARPQTPRTLSPALPATGQPGARQQPEAATKMEVPAETPLPPLLPPPAELAPLQKLAVRTPVVAAAPLTDREALAKKLKEAPTAKEPAVELKLAQSIATPVVSAELEEAYGALKNADYERARALYGKLVLADPLSIDAQLGMATALARGGDSSAAGRHYRQVLVIDPRNGAALAGLLAVSDARLPSLEVELRTLVGRNPDTSSLRFTLGNLYASERRWVEAQQAYFEAYRLESGNADYLYNLAVSLDQLKQPKLAVEYYEKALAARPKAGGQFDPAAVTRRIKDLTAESRIN